MTIVATTRTRDVSAAAAASMTSCSWLRKVTRSPTATLAKGPASMRRHHSRVVVRS